MRLESKIVYVITLGIFLLAPIAFAEESEFPKKFKKRSQDWRSTIETLRDALPDRWLKGVGTKTLLTPSLKYRGTFSSNLFLFGKDDFESWFSPALNFKADTARTELFLGGRWDIYRYVNRAEFNNEEQFYAIKAARWFSETVQLGVWGDFEKYNLMRKRTEEFGETPGPAGYSQDAMSAYIRPKARWHLNSQNTFELPYSFERREFDGDNFADYNVQQLAVSWTNLFTETTILSLELGGSLLESTQNNSEVSGTEQHLRAMAGVKLYLSSLELGLKAGARVTGSEFDSETEGVDESNWGFVAFGDMLYKTGLGLRVRGHYSHEQEPGLYGEFLTRDRLVLRLEKDLNPRTIVSLNARHDWLESEGFVKKEKRRTYFIQPRLRYRFTENYFLIAMYRFSKQINLLNDDVANEHKVMLDLELIWPRLL